MKKTYSILYQSVVIGLIVLLSKLIEKMLPFVMPASVIGLVLLFLALSFKFIKLEEVEDVGDKLVSNIGLFFVPAGVSVINSLGILKAHFVLDIVLIFTSTVILLVSTGWMTQMILKMEPQKAFHFASIFTKQQESKARRKSLATSNSYSK
ncbi:antiholin-like protein LrgA [Streptococcus iniae]|uniref:Antiholin-like protein LrgA n=1 Tax=Streptococcus iniae TaxID=1346 RepID=A0A1J0MXJ9_STRIN|nr:antiholin-like murein hydrolase modulator LrgA [Streptococcus iniae]AGM98202.1 antiholin-like protein LrgA [Streptococcus iniae SF1]AHY15264.1 murein hydrolase transporter LrgA [Streptococcus iniae]AHY17133.1 murein hydrolase transporter LrgA [Streptococcus iniae]AJG25447.1 murein hydrolase transporter LrgA [Streptococcus iniae]APD31315.1 murein hydrolase transporter LrgA [Streptococcus iniae]